MDFFEFVALGFLQVRLGFEFCVVHAGLGLPRGALFVGNQLLDVSQFVRLRFLRVHVSLEFNLVPLVGNPGHHGGLLVDVFLDAGELGGLLLFKFDDLSFGADFGINGIRRVLRHFGQFVVMDGCRSGNE